MYAIVDDYLLDEVPLASLSPEDQRKVGDTVESLKHNCRPIVYGWRLQQDGSSQISIAIGIRRVLLGYDVNDKKELVLLNYVKWDRFREALDWTIGLLGNEPGRKK